MRDGVAGYLDKPLEEEVLLKTIAAVISRRCASGSTAAVH
jgi:hypothetical protein